MINSVFLTDLYQLTMMAGYFQNKMDEIAIFEVFTRKYPPNRCYFIAAGLEQILDYVQNIKFTDDEIEYLRKNKTFSHIKDDFFEYLKNFKFTGDIWAMPEGTVFFPNEPVIRVTAPIIQAQLLETYILSVFNFQSMIATKASIVTYEAQDRKVIEFGSRRAHGPEAAALAGRAAYIGGCIGTSNAYAGYKFGIPAYGTIAHSWVLAFDKEQESFEKYFQAFPESTILLVDTYDTVEGVKKAVKISPKIRGVRLDSGDLYELSVESRKILDDAGLKDAIIIASGDLDEYKVKKLIDKDAPIDVFGVGTTLATSSDAPFFNGIYKLVEIEKDNKLIQKAKFSENKATYPGKKLVWRFLDENNKLINDIVADIEEDYSDNATQLLVHTVKNGKQLIPNPPITKIQEYCLSNLTQLDKKSLGVNCSPVTKVEISQKLKDKFNQVLKEHQSE